MTESDAAFRRRVDEAKEAHRATLRAYLDGLKDKPCVDCQQPYPRHAMQFAPRPGVERRFRLSEWQFLLPSLEVLQEEAAKHEVVCANCNAGRHEQRRKRCA